MLRSKFSQPDWLDDQFYLKMIFDWFYCIQFSLLLSLHLSLILSFSFSSKYFYSSIDFVCKYVSKLAHSIKRSIRVNFPIHHHFKIHHLRLNGTVIKRGSVIFFFIIQINGCKTRRTQRNLYTIEDVGTNNFAFSLFTRNDVRGQIYWQRIVWEYCLMPILSTMYIKI